jgi:hypothetical protein
MSISESKENTVKVSESDPRGNTKINFRSWAIKEKKEYFDICCSDPSHLEGTEVAQGGRG